MSAEKLLPGIIIKDYEFADRCLRCDDINFCEYDTECFRTYDVELVACLETIDELCNDGNRCRALEFFRSYEFSELPLLFQ